MKRERYTRSYGGVIVSSHNYQELLKEEGEDAIKFHKKHLKAYTRGKRVFTHGKNEDGDPIFHMVEQKVSLIEK